MKKNYTLALFLMIVSTACGGGEVVSETEKNVNTLDQAGDVAVNSAFKYTFDSIINWMTVDSTNYFILQTPLAAMNISKRAIDDQTCNPVNALAALINCTGLSCTLDPVEDLQGGVNYTICLTTSIRYLRGGLFEGFMATFTTAESAATYTVGGSVSGLGAGDQTIMQNNGADNLAVAANGSFTFATALSDGAAYSVTVLTNPAGKTCTVTNGEGTISGANVTGVLVDCAAGPTPVPQTPKAPGIAAIKAGLVANNARGMVPGLALGAITLPVCTKTDGTPLDFTVDYSMAGLPAWLLFDTSTRGLALNGVATVPAGAYTGSDVTYTCANALDATKSSSASFTVNDLDQGGVTDGHEYNNGYVPLVNDQGSIRLNPSNIELYRGGITTFNVPTSLVIVNAGMDPTVSTDDTADFDGDTFTNLTEIQAGTDIFVAVSTGTFAAAVNYTVRNSPVGITIADFNNNGILDFVVTNHGNDSISVYYGNGNGTFGARYDKGSGDGPYDITAGDFNNDGNMDVALTNYNDRNFFILLGDGSGTFGSPDSYFVGNAPCGIITGDFDSDGDLDIATANIGSDNISVLLGNGDGTFAGRVDYGAGDEPFYMTTGDFDGDGDLDLVLTNDAPNTVSILLGNGNGTFAAAVSYSTGNEPYDIIAGDFDGDGDLDIATANYAGDNASVLLGNGNGTFAPVVNYATGDSSYGIATADFDGDGDLDLIVTNNMTSNVSLLRGNGNGTFAAAVNSAIGNGPRDINLGDFDGDGDLDIAVVNISDTNVSIRLNQ